MRRLSAAAGMLALTALAPLATALVPPLAAQGAGPRVGAPAAGEGADAVHNVPYDGRFTFARIRFDPMGGESDFFGRRDLKWDHDFPRAERNFMRILRELSTVRPYMDGGNVFTLDDPELFKYPVAYMSEPGFWAPTDKEADALRTYLQKGGFIIFDDFFGAHWYNFETQLRKVLPQARFVPLDPSHPIFDSFFRIEAPAGANGGGRRGQAQFVGVFEDNDPTKRLLMIANYNNDIGENWEWSDSGFIPVELSNEAYKLGVNYVVYAMTH